MDKTMLEAACNEEHAAMLRANSADPYVHAEYRRHESLLKAALMLWTDGDEPYAAALFDAYLDSDEELDWYVRGGGYSRDELVHNFGHD